MVCFINPPVGFSDSVGPLPDGAELVRPDAERFDHVVFFSKSQDLVKERLESIRQRISPKGILWLGWLDEPTSTDLDFNRIQMIGLSQGMVDNKVGPLDRHWNGIRFVVRPQNRSTWPDRP